MSKLNVLTTGLITLGVFAVTTVASAAPSRIFVRLPDGFCTLNADGTRGVREDGQTYSAWLAEHAFGNEVAYRTQLHAEGMPDAEIDREVARMKAEEARFQMLNIRRGQDARC